MISQPNPYIGPQFFQVEQAELFFGRDREAIDLTSLIIAEREVVLHAKSGAGKTSLINAKIIPELKKEDFYILPTARVRGRVPVTLKVDEIKNLYSFFTIMSWDEDKTPPNELKEQTLDQYLQKMGRNKTSDGKEPGGRRLIIFDQFEELFTYHGEREKDREEFIEQLSKILEKDISLWVLFIIRDDYLRQLDQYANYFPDKLKKRYWMNRLDIEGARAAIVNPLGVESVNPLRRKYDDTVIERLVNDLAKEKGETVEGNVKEVPGEYIEPVQLQIVCRNLWSRLGPEVRVITESDLQEFGDVDKAMEDYYEDSIKETIKGNGVKEGDLRQWFDNHLITKARTRGTVYHGREGTAGIPNEAIERLKDVYIIRVESRSGSKWIELSHDRLIDPILNSNRKWREALLKESPLADTAARWVIEKDPDFLFRGKQLEEAEKWAEEKREWLSEEQSEFLERSKEQAQYERRKKNKRKIIRRNAAIFTPLVVIGILIILYLSAAAERRVKKEYEILGRSHSIADMVIEDEVDKNIATQLALHAYLIAKKQGPVTKQVVDVTPYNRALQTVYKEDITFSKRKFDKFDEERWLKTFAFHPTGEALAYTLDNGSVDLIKKEEGFRPIRIEQSKTHSIAFSSDGSKIATAAENNLITLWDYPVSDSIPIQKYREIKLEKTGEVLSIAFNVNNRFIATGSDDGTILLLDLDKSEGIQDDFPRKHQSAVLSLAFYNSDKEKGLISLGVDGEIIFWDLDKQKKANHWKELAEELAEEREEGKEGEKDITIATFNKNYKKMAVGIRDGDIFIIDLDDPQNPKVDKRLEIHKDQISSLSFSSGLEGRRILASCSNIGVMYIWDLEKEEKHEKLLPLFKDHGVFAEFSPDEKNIFSVSNNNRWSWIPHIEVLAEKLCDTIERNLTLEEWERYFCDIPFEQECRTDKFSKESYKNDHKKEALRMAALGEEEKAIQTLLMIKNSYKAENEGGERESHLKKLGNSIRGFPSIAEENLINAGDYLISWTREFLSDIPEEIEKEVDIWKKIGESLEEAKTAAKDLNDKTYLEKFEKVKNINKEAEWYVSEVMKETSFELINKNAHKQIHAVAKSGKEEKNEMVQASKLLDRAKKLDKEVNSEMEEQTRLKTLLERAEKSDEHRECKSFEKDLNKIINHCSQLVCEKMKEKDSVDLYNKTKKLKDMIGLEEDKSDLKFHYDLCACGDLESNFKDVKEHCNDAVKLAKKLKAPKDIEVICRLFRGLALGLTNEEKDAMDDFREYKNWVGKNIDFETGNMIKELENPDGTGFRNIIQKYGWKVGHGGRKRAPSGTKEEGK